jgi:hypothetical protein
MVEDLAQQLLGLRRAIGSGSEREMAFALNEMRNWRRRFEPAAVF